MTDAVLRFISGKQQGREIPLPDGGQLLIGRADEADVQIPDDDTVSRKHAIISVAGDEIVLLDCSRNGTCVNGRPMTSSLTLKPGDQIHIGRAILKLVVHSPVPVPAGLRDTQRLAIAGMRTLPSAPARPESARAVTATTEHFRGSIADIALTDLLQLLITTRKTGALVLRSRDMIGRIHLSAGQICHATLDDAESVNALKVFYRLMRWSDGTFELEPGDAASIPKSISEPNDFLLLEAMHQLDEINNLGPQLPPLHAEIVLANPLPAPLRDLAPGDLDFIQLVLRHKTVRGILDHYAGSDFEAYTYLKSLMGRHYLVVSES